MKKQQPKPIFRGLFLLLAYFSTLAYLHAQETDLKPTLLWEEKTYTSYKNSAYCVAFSPDGRYLASGFQNSTIKIWEAGIGVEVQTLKGHTNSVCSVAFSSNGRYLASGSFDNTIKIWEVDSGKEIRTLKGHTNWVRSVTFSLDGRYLASGSFDNIIKIWEVNTSKEIQTLTGHTNSVHSVAFSPNSRYLASGSEDKTIKIWEVDAGREIQTLKGHTSGVCSVAFGVSEHYLVSGSSDYTIKLWGLEKKQLLFDSNEGISGNNVGFIRNGEFIFSNKGGIYSTKTNKKIMSLPIETHSSMSTNGKYYARAYNKIEVYEIPWLPKEYQEEMKKELAKSPLFTPKDEFETQAEYEARQKKAQQFSQELNAKYEAKREQEIHASMQEKCYSIEKLSDYNADKQTFDITAVGKTYTLSIPREEARSLKENLSSAKVCGIERLQFYSTGKEIVNLQVVHPTTGKRYPFGEQIDLPTEVSLPAVSKIETPKETPKKNKEKKIQEPETPKEKPKNKDKTPPAITFDNLPASSPSKMFVLKGEVREQNGIKSIRINGKEIPFFPDGRFEQEVELKEGQNTFTVQASDLAGNASEKRVSLAYRFAGKFPLPKRLALLVGNSAYKYTYKLEKPRADAEEMKKALEALNFKVIVLYDGSKEAMRTTIDDFTQELKTGGYDVGLFFYAGHGAQIDLKMKSHNFLIPTDAKLQDDQKAEFECVYAQEILDGMERSGVKVRLLFLDACRDNPYQKVYGKKRVLGSLESGKGSFVSYATDSGRQAWEDGDGKNSHFTAALLKYINQPNRSIGQIMQTVTKEVSEKTKGNQEPGSYNKLTDDFYFLIEE
jgi:Caspase domain/WD domain, G-beta repeat/Glucodextranase, domain B